MVLFNYATRELTAKVVYYGPGLCGKTTNLHFIYDSLPSTNKSKMLSLATQTDRTLFFDFLPLDLGRIRGMRTRLQLYTVPGQVYYNSTRQLVLKGADGVVFVADSQDVALDANLESLQNLEDNLRKQGIRIAEIPLVIQYNKRDLPNAMPVAELEKALNKLRVRSYESVATTGAGVETTLNGIAQLVLNHLARKYGLDGGEDAEREFQILSPGEPVDRKPAESIWKEDPPEQPASTAPPPPPAVTEPPPPPQELIAPSLIQPMGAEEEAFGFEQLIERFDAVDVRLAEPEPAPPPVLNAEIFLPEPSTASAGVQVAPPPAAPPELIKEITLPLNLTMDELQRHRKMKLRITLEVNLLK
jgi:signal recognition particle receptor subunit beta